MALGRKSGLAMACDLAPTTAAGRNGRGKACTITELLVFSRPPLHTFLGNPYLQARGFTN